MVLSAIKQLLKLLVGQTRRALKQLPAALIVLWAFPAAALDMRDYWPSLPTGRQQITQNEASQGGNTWFGLTQRYVNRGTVRGNPVLRLDDFNGTGWLDAWELRNDGSQILEVGDQFPSGHKVYEIGKEFSWGGVVNVGDVIIRTVHVDVAASVGEVVGPHNWGTEVLTVEAFHPTFTNGAGLAFTDVVQVRMFQSFCITSACTWPTGQATWITRHWFAPGKGIIQTEYLTVNSAPVSPQRIDSATSIITTWETP